MGKKKNFKKKISKQKNTTMKNPDEMEKAAEDRATQSTSRASCSEKESSPTPSDLSADRLVSNIMELACDNVTELLGSISRWKAEAERANSQGESSDACCFDEKLKRHQKRFFKLRRVFAEFADQPAEKQDLSETTDDTATLTSTSVPTELVNAADKDVTPEEFIEDTKIDALSQQDDKDICNTSLTVSQKSPSTVSICSEDVSSDPLFLAPASQPSSSSSLGDEKNEDEKHSSDVRSICLSPKQMSPITLAVSSENLGAVEKADQSFVLSEKLTMDFSQEEQCCQETGHGDVRSVVEAEASSSSSSLGDEKNVDETHSSDVHSISLSPKQMSPITLAVSSENLGAVEKADQSFVLSEKLTMDFSQEEQCCQETGHGDVRSVVEAEASSSSSSLGDKKNVDETHSSDVHSISLSPKQMSPITLAVSSENLGAVEKADQSFVLSEKLTMDFSQEEQCCQETGHGEVRSVVEAEASSSSSSLGDKKNVDETHSSDVRSISLSPKQMSPITLAVSSENLGAVEKADQSFVLSEKLTMDFSQEEQCCQETGHGDIRSVVEAEGLVTKMGSTLVLSGQDGSASGNLKSISSSPEKMSPTVSIGFSEVTIAAQKADQRSVPPAVTQLTGLQNIFHTIVTDFCDGLTERQRTEISHGIYYMDVKDKLLDLSVDILTVSLQTITDALKEAICQNGATFQPRGIETFKQKLLSQLLWMKFDITEDNTQQTLGSTLGMTFCDVISAETSIKIPPKFKDTIVKNITHKISSAASVAIPALEDEESIVDEKTWCQFSCCSAFKKMLSGVNTVLHGCKVSVSDSDAPNLKVHKKSSRWWKCFRKQRNEIQAVSNRQMDTLLNKSEDTGQNPAYTQDDEDKVTNGIKESEKDPAAEAKRPSLLKRIRRFCCRLCCCSPGEIEQ